MDVFEAMGTAVSMRWLKPDPVPEELVERVLWAATRASNPGNSQPWDFVVVRDETVRHDIARLMTSRFGGLGRGSEGAPAASATRARMLEGGRYLVEHLDEVPVWIFVCATNVYPPKAPQLTMMYSAAFAAAQNLLVAARALGLGATYTTFHQADPAGLTAMLGIPESSEICVTLPLGWPGRSFGVLSRRPLEEVVHHDHW
jgi:nitroreductase